MNLDYHHANEDSSADWFQIETFATPTFNMHCFPVHNLGSSLLSDDCLESSLYRRKKCETSLDMHEKAQASAGDSRIILLPVFSYRPREKWGMFGDVHKNCMLLCRPLDEDWDVPCSEVILLD
jgi:hypothetical protein